MAYDNGAKKSRMPPLGWSSWVALGKDWGSNTPQHPEFDFCDEVSVKASIDAFHEVGLWDAGYRHFHLDDCWADKSRNATGYLQPERDHFPNGMKPLVDYAHSKGLTYGLYTCAGDLTCVGGRPGSRGHFEKDAAVFAEWGVDVVKMDWCHTDGMDPKTTMAEFSRALNGTGRHIHFNMCEWGKDSPWEWGPDIAQSWRATQDHIPVWDSTKAIIKQRTAVPPSLGGAPFAWNDMDMVETGNYKQAAHANGREGTMTETEYKTEFSMWAILASPLIVTTPILNCSSTDAIRGNYTPGKCKAELTGLQREILLNGEVLAVNQDVTLAGRLVSPSLAAVATSAPSAMVYARNLSDGSVAVALYNPEDVAAQASFDFSSVGLQGGRVRDLWAHEDLGTFMGRYPETGNVTVEAHGTTMLRIAPASTLVV